MSFFGGSAATTANTSSSGDKDVEIAEPPTDSISSISFSPAADYLAVGSWDNSVRSAKVVLRVAYLQRLQVRIYEIGPQGQSQGKAMYQHQGPVLDVCWNKVRASKWLSNVLSTFSGRMGPKSSLAVRTMLGGCST